MKLSKTLCKKYERTNGEGKPMNPDQPRGHIINLLCRFCIRSEGCIPPNIFVKDGRIWRDKEEMICKEVSGDERE